MRPDIAKTASTIAEFIPNIISGTTLEFMPKANITNKQLVMIMVLYRFKRCTMGFLAERLHVTMPTVTGIVSRLHRLGLVKRSTCHSDRRRVYIELAGKGLKLIEGFQALVRHRWSQLLTALEPDEVRCFRQIFEKINRSTAERNDEIRN